MKMKVGSLLPRWGVALLIVIAVLEKVRNCGLIYVLFPYVCTSVQRNSLYNHLQNCFIRIASSIIIISY